MIQKFEKFKLENSAIIVGGETSETEASRRKSADKLHNKIQQLIMS